MDNLSPPKGCSVITALLLVPLIFDHTLNPHLPMGLSYPEPSPLDYNLSNALGNNWGGHIEKMPWFFCLLVSTHNLFNWEVLTLTDTVENGFSPEIRNRPLMEEGHWLIKKLPWPI